MKLIIHAGMPKAGSTVLQGRLQDARARLRKQGILYPGRGLNHNFLTAGVMALDEMPRIFRQHYRDDAGAVARDFAEFWSDVKDRAAALQPETIVMSGEALWGVRKKHASALGALLRELSDDIEVMVYARKPSDFYLSAVQQGLKASHMIGKVRAVRYRPAIEAFERVTDKVHVAAYDRGAFPGGDVCADFAGRFLPDAADCLAPQDGKTQENVSLSAEAMSVLQKYRQHVHAERRNVFTGDTGALMNALRTVGGERPSLRPEVRERIDRSSPDLLWLRDTYGVAFDDVPYGAIAEEAPWQPDMVTSICVVDPVREEETLYRAIGELLRDEAAKDVKFRTVFRPKQREKDGAAD